MATSQTLAARARAMARPSRRAAPVTRAAPGTASVIQGSGHDLEIGAGALARQASERDGLLAPRSAPAGAEQREAPVAERHAQQGAGDVSADIRHLGDAAF